MAIEVRQITIRSVVSPELDGRALSPSAYETKKLREDILRECRRLVRELMRADRER
jgi:hypothetical protein